MRIPSGLHAEILTRAGKGDSSNVIAEWLKQAHGVTVTGRGVRMFLAKIREERAGITHAIVTEKLSKSVTADLDGLDRILADLVALTDEADAVKMPEGKELPAGAKLGRVGLKAELLDKQRKVIETKLKLSGAMVPEPAGVGEDARRDLFARFDALVERHEAEAPPTQH